MFMLEHWKKIYLAIMTRLRDKYWSLMAYDYYLEAYGPIVQHSTFLIKAANNTNANYWLCLYFIGH